MKLDLTEYVTRIVDGWKWLIAISGAEPSGSRSRVRLVMTSHVCVIDMRNLESVCLNALLSYMLVRRFVWK
jgi:hypothetical protein